MTLESGVSLIVRTAAPDYSAQHNIAGKLIRQLGEPQAADLSVRSAMVARGLAALVASGTAIPSADTLAAADAVIYNRASSPLTAAPATSVNGADRSTEGAQEIAPFVPSSLETAAPSPHGDATSNPPTAIYTSTDHFTVDFADGTTLQVPRTVEAGVDMGERKRQVTDGLEKLCTACSEPGCLRPATSRLTLWDLVGQQPLGFGRDRKMTRILEDPNLPERLAGRTSFDHCLEAHCDTTARYALMAAQLAIDRCASLSRNPEVASFAKSLLPRIYRQEQGTDMSEDLEKLVGEYAKLSRAMTEKQHADDIASSVCSFFSHLDEEGYRVTTFTSPQSTSGRVSVSAAHGPARDVVVLGETGNEGEA